MGSRERQEEAGTAATRCHRARHRSEPTAARRAGGGVTAQSRQELLLLIWGCGDVEGIFHMPQGRDSSRRRRGGVVLQHFCSELQSSKSRGWFCFSHNGVNLFLQTLALAAPEEFRCESVWCVKPTSFTTPSEAPFPAFYSQTRRSQMFWLKCVWRKFCRSCFMQTDRTN